MRIVVADDDPAMFKRLEQSIYTLDSSFGHLEVCGKARDGKELIELVERHNPIDLVITDVRMPLMAMRQL